MKNIVLVAAVFLAIARAHAETHWIMDDAEEGFRVSQIQTLPHQLPEKIAEKRFADFQSAQEFLNRENVTRDQSGAPKSEFEFRTEVVGEVVWPTRNEWNWDWERQFGEWVQTEMDENFPGRYHVSVDCADVELSLRWIFSRIHYLPAGNRVGGTSILFTNESMRREWRNLPTAENWQEDQRFRAALRYVLDHAYTSSLNLDSYPIEFNLPAITAGAFFLTLSDNLRGGHTVVIQDVNAQDSSRPPLKFMWGTEPQSENTLSWDYQAIAGLFNRQRGGLLRPRWVIRENGQWKLKSEREMPYYSTEQYGEGFIPENQSMELFLWRRINPNVDLALTARALGENLILRVQDRVRIVNDGYVYCRTHDCAPGTEGYEAWSTPNRDARLLKFFEGLAFVSGNVEGSSIYDEFMLRPAYEAGGRIFSLGFLKYLLGWSVSTYENSFLSHDPRDPIPLRWPFFPLDFATQYKRVLERHLYERARLIEEAEICRVRPSDCGETTSLFLRLHSGLTDFMIASMPDRGGYQTVAGTDDAESAFGSLSRDLLTISGMTYSYENWHLRAEFFTADPRNPVPMRWESRPFAF